MLVSGNAGKSLDIKLVRIVVMGPQYRRTSETLIAAMLAMGLVGLVRLLLALRRGTDLYEPVGVMLIGFAITALVYVGFSRSER